MRLSIEMQLPRPVAVPVNHQELLQAVVYRLLAASDGEYARFLHNEGYAMGDSEEGVAGKKRFKLFVFSGLRAAPRQRRIVGDTLHLGAGPVRWLFSSPMEPVLQHVVNGLLTEGRLHVGDVSLPVTHADALPCPDFSSGKASFTCLTPMVAAVAAPGRPTPRYLRPCDGDEFSEAARKNVLHKFRALHGRDAEDDRFHLRFNEAYLSRDPRGGVTPSRDRGTPSRDCGTKLIHFKQTGIVGAFAPFALTGAPELLQLAFETGIGEKNSAGFGMIEVDR